jgi:hypothetical protein
MRTSRGRRSRSGSKSYGTEASPEPEEVAELMSEAREFVVRVRERAAVLLGTAPLPAKDLEKG